MSYEAALCVQRLKVLGRKQGILTYAQVDLHLPPSMVDPEEILAVVEKLERSGVRVVENLPTDGN